MSALQKRSCQYRVGESSTFIYFIIVCIPISAECVLFCTSRFGSRFSSLSLLPLALSALAAICLRDYSAIPADRVPSDGRGEQMALALRVSPLSASPPLPSARLAGRFSLLFVFYFANSACLFFSFIRSNEDKSSVDIIIIHWLLLS